MVEMKLPDGWVQANIDDLIGSRGVFRDGDWVESKDQDPEGDVRLVQLADIGDGEFRDKSSRLLTSEKAAELNCTFLQNGDVLVARMPDPLGRACLFPLHGDKKFVTVVDVCVIRFGHQFVSEKYFTYILNSPMSRKKISEHQTGSTRKRISRGNLSTIQFPVPPVSEQHRIVAKIEELFSELDKGIESLKTAQAQLKVYRQALLKHAFEGKLTAQWRAENQDKLESAESLLARIQTEREQRYQQQLQQWQASGKQGSKPKAPKALPPLTAEELEELPELPEGWEWEKNENYLSEIKDGTHDTPKYVEEGIPFVTQKNIRDGKLDIANVSNISIDDHEKFYKRSNVQKGDLIISMIGHGRGECCLVNVDTIFSIKNVGLFKFFNGLQSSELLKFYYQSTAGLNLVLSKSKGGAQPFIGLTELRDWPVPVFSHEEQIVIVEILDVRLSEADQLEQSLTTSLQQAEALRQSILKKAFSGQLVAQDPDDEPASELLARIKALKSEISLKKRVQA